MVKTKEEIDKLVTENINLVHMVINRNFKNHVKIYKDIDVYEDVFQEGSIGLYAAAKDFDESRGFKFSTFACNCITKRLLKFNQRYLQKHYRSDLVYLNTNIRFKDGDEIELQDTIKDYEAGYKDLEIIEIMNELQKYLTDQEKTVIRLRLAGDSQVGIANKIKISQCSVSRVLRRIRKKIDAIENNTEIKKSVITTNRNPAIKRNQVLVNKTKELRNRGFTYKQIAEELNIKSGTIGSYLRAI